MKKVNKYINEQLQIIKPNILYYCLVYLIAYIYLIYTKQNIESDSFPYFSFFTPISQLFVPFIISLIVFFPLALNVKMFQNIKFGLVFLIITILVFFFTPS